jgi:quercetin dioxygenase-like cupin family protein
MLPERSALAARRTAGGGSLTISRIKPRIACAAYFNGAESGERTMEAIRRRSALALGLAAAAVPAIVSSRALMAQAYGPNEGKEVAPGVRQVDLSEQEAMIPAYKAVSMRDIVFQPGANTPNNTMKNDMVCHITEGELRVVQDGQKEFRAKKGDVWSCAVGTTEQGWNEGEVVAIMRVIDLMTA